MTLIADPDPTDETTPLPPKAGQRPDENGDDAASFKTADLPWEAEEGFLEPLSSIHELQVYINQQRGW